MPARAAISIDNRPPSIPKGAIKTFGPYGPKYEVGEAGRPLANGDWIVNVTLVESGEVVEYGFFELIQRRFNVRDCFRP